MVRVPPKHVQIATRQPLKRLQGAAFSSKSFAWLMNIHKRYESHQSACTMVGPVVQYSWASAGMPEARLALWLQGRG